MSLRVRLLAVLSCVLPFAFGVGTARANDPRIEQEIEETLLRLLDMGALEASAPGRPIVIEREARMRYELGAIVARPRGEDGGGLEVLALTPRGQAERMGLHVGDRILEINGEDLSRSADPGKAMARALLRSRGSLHVELLRGTRRMQIEGSAEAIEVPGFRLRIDRPLPRSKPTVVEPNAAEG